MNVIICKDYEEISCVAANMAATQINEKPDSVLGLPTGDTPLGMYKNLIKKNIDFSDIKTFNLDEYYPISPDNTQSYSFYMRNNFFEKINIKPENTFIPNGMTDKIEAECTEYENKINEAGGIDLMILGIGNNGHIGFNEPESNLCPKVHSVQLSESTIKANSRFFSSQDNVPKQAITMGMGTILNAKKIIILASGYKKLKAVKEILNGKINTDYPATFLNMHNDVTLICDRDAYEANSVLGIDIGGTNIKFGVIKDEKIIYKSRIATNQNSSKELVDEIAKECKKIGDKFDYGNIGVGVAGGIENGLVSGDNLPFENYPLANELEKKLNKPVNTDNDANCSGLAEINYGIGRKYKNMILLTIGTGIGGCIIIDGKIHRGLGCAGEFGHMIVNCESGKKCPCGMYGCFEQYASANALLKLAEEYANNNKKSLLWQAYEKNGFDMSGEVFFDALESGCETADEVIRAYTDYLSDGINGLISIFDPEVVVLTGGIMDRSELFIDMINKKIHFNTQVLASKLKNDAGILGAACL